VARLVTGGSRRYPEARPEHTDRGWLIRLDGPGEDVLPAGVDEAGVRRSLRLGTTVEDAYLGLDEVTKISDDEPAAEAATVFQTALQNGNPVIHPAVTLLNAALIDRTGGDFAFYEEGVTTSTGRLMEAVDGERFAIAEALGVSILSEPAIGVLQGYMTEANYTTGYSTAPGFLGIKAQDSLDNRYLTEDVGYSMVFFTDLARSLGVATPVMDAVVQIASVVLARDFRSEAARTMDSLGLDDLSAEELRRY
jgi:opine dehydrogenase